MATRIEKISKVIRVIDSCKNWEQLMIAQKWANNVLANDKPFDFMDYFEGKRFELMIANDRVDEKLTR